MQSELRRRDLSFDSGCLPACCINGLVAARSIPQETFETYFGCSFECVARQWMLRELVKGDLPVAVSGFRSWWGANPTTKHQEDIDFVAVNRFSKEVLVDECKWRQLFNETQALKKLHERAALLKGYSVVG